jgi:predicted nucleic acid-binding protein
LHDAAFKVVLSPAIIDEVLRALAYPEVHRLMRHGADPQLWFEDILVLADLVGGAYNLAAACPDPDDDKYLAAAIEGRAAFVVTGDRQFLALGAYDEIRIVSPRAFLDLLGA